MASTVKYLINQFDLWQLSLESYMFSVHINS